MWEIVRLVLMLVVGSSRRYIYNYIQLPMAVLADTGAMTKLLRINPSKRIRLANTGNTEYDGDDDDGGDGDDEGEEDDGFVVVIATALQPLHSTSSSSSSSFPAFGPRFLL